MTHRAIFALWVALCGAIFLTSCGDPDPQCAAGECLPRCGSQDIQPAPMPDADKSTLTADPTNGISADGTTKSTITLTARNSSNNPMANYLASIEVTGTNNFVTPSPLTTDSNGVATWVLASTTAETKVVTASILYDLPCPCGANCFAAKAQVTLNQTASIEFVSP